jgi:aryl-alcohol dehydrogenase-like predicted oxidoreductase
MGYHAFSGRKQAPSFTEDKTVQNPYSLLNRLLKAVRRNCVREDVGLLAYTPMAFGCYPENF